MEPVQVVTSEAVEAGGHFYLVMNDGSDGWITPNVVILPGRNSPTKSSLIIRNCAIQEKLSFLYNDYSGKKTVVSTGKRVREIFRMTHPVTV